ncbi:MAG: cysteine desulfurase NifS [Candidatus Eisenbacteria bacterium]|nr:cysteine desulfurase NifS [Candidatus Eisenbacteria bacterium]
MKRIYLDHNATTPLDPAVLEEMLPFLTEKFGNASSVHSAGQEARRAVEQARERLARLIGADASEIVFTSGGTEADNHALRGVVDPLGPNAACPHIVTSAIEHPAVLNTCQMLEKRGCAVTYVPVDEHARVDVEQVRSAIKPETKIVSIMLANNEVGTIQPVAEIAAIAHEHGALVHTDAVQALGRLPIDVRKLGVDLMSVSSHKIYGPKGIGALYLRRGVRVTPLLFGGHQERHRRGGTENVPAIVGFGKASELAGALREERATRERELRDRLERAILERIPHTRVNGHPTERLPNTLNAAFRFVEGESLLMNLDFEGVAVSTGSACSSGDLKPSHVLVAMGLPVEEAHGTLRFSLGRSTTEEDIDAASEALVRVVDRVRAMSPMYRDFLKRQETAPSPK